MSVSRHWRKIIPDISGVVLVGGTNMQVFMTIVGISIACEYQFPYVVLHHFSLNPTKLFMLCSRRLVLTSFEELIRQKASST